MLKKFVEILEFINHQIGIDLLPISEANGKKRAYIHVDLSKLSCLQVQTLYRFAHSSKRFDLQFNGGYGYALFPNAPNYVNSQLVKGII